MQFQEVYLPLGRTLTATFDKRFDVLSNINSPVSTTCLLVLNNI